MASPTEISVSQLNRLIGTPAQPTIVDVRINEDFSADPHLIPTAKQFSHIDIDNLVNYCQQTKPKKVIIYCQKGLKISQGVAAILRNHGVSAETLEGGQLAWRDALLPLIPANKIPIHYQNKSTVWVTRHRPKIDRIACPWLIRRFIDPQAQFLFVAPSQVDNVAEKFQAIPFDSEGAFWSHRGDFCTFDTMLEEFALHTKPLDQLALIVRGADTNRHALAPESAGLLAASLGLSRMYKDDLAQLDAAMSLYDSFYRWCRDATNESHDWPINVKKP